jgi:hypothetical protein
MQPFEVWSLYRDAAKHRLMTERPIEGVLRELRNENPDEIDGPVLYEDLNEVTNEQCYIVDLRMFPALLKRAKNLRYAWVYINGDNFLGWARFAERGDAYVMFEDTIGGWSE